MCKDVRYTCIPVRPRSGTLLFGLLVAQQDKSLNELASMMMSVRAWVLLELRDIARHSAKSYWLHG